MEGNEPKPQSEPQNELVGEPHNELVGEPQNEPVGDPQNELQRKCPE